MVNDYDNGEDYTETHIKLKIHIFSSSKYLVSRYYDWIPNLWLPMFLQEKYRRDWLHNFGVYNWC